MTYSLKRVQDGAGDSGPLFEMYKLDPQTKEIISHGNPEKPEIGYAIRVGSIIARTYSAQDYWTTTPVTEILEETKTEEEHYVKFKTGNSVYEWKQF